MNTVLKISNVNFEYKKNQPILQDIHFTISAGESVFLMGKSGGGKSTLLNIAAGLLIPSEGEVFINDTDITKLKISKLTQFRGEHMGYIFQAFHLMNNMTALENVALPLELQGIKKSVREDKAYELLEELGLEDRAEHYPHELSGGEQQRVSIARALITNPKIIFADEPTGNLDTETGNKILSLFQSIKNKYNTAFFIATHDLDAAKTGDRIVRIQNGRLSL